MIIKCKCINIDRKVHKSYLNYSQRSGYYMSTLRTLTTQPGPYFALGLLIKSIPHITSRNVDITPVEALAGDLGLLDDYYGMCDRCFHNMITSNALTNKISIKTLRARIRLCDNGCVCNIYTCNPLINSLDYILKNYPNGITATEVLTGLHSTLGKLKSQNKKRIKDVHEGAVYWL